MAGTDGLERLEKLCWHLSGWQVDQCSVDRLMTEIRAYVQTHTPEASAMLAVRLPEALQEPVTAEPSPPDPIVPQESTRGRVRPMVPGGDGPSRTCRTCHGYWALRSTTAIPRASADARASAGCARTGASARGAANKRYCGKPPGSPRRRRHEHADPPVRRPARDVRPRRG
jgi:hypothetical protein